MSDHPPHIVEGNPEYVNKLAQLFSLIIFVFSGICLVVVFIYSDTKLLVLSDVKLLYVMIFGCFMGVYRIFSTVLKPTDAICWSSSLLGVFGFLCTFGVLWLKTWRLNEIIPSSRGSVKSKKSCNAWLRKAVMVMIYTIWPVVGMYLDGLHAGERVTTEYNQTTVHYECMYHRRTDTLSYFAACIITLSVGMT